MILQNLSVCKEREWLRYKDIRSSIKYNCNILEINYEGKKFLLAIFKDNRREK